MTRLIAFSVMFAVALLLLGCDTPDGSVRNLDTLVSQLEAASFEATTNAQPLKFHLEFAGTLIWASPHSVGGNQLKLTAQVGASVTQKLLDRTGLSESFHVFLVTDSGRVKGLRWDKPAFVFNDLFIVKCQRGDFLVLDVQDKTLKGVRVERE